MTGSRRAGASRGPRRTSTSGRTGWWRGLALGRVPTPLGRAAAPLGRAAAPLGRAATPLIRLGSAFGALPAARRIAWITIAGGLFRLLLLGQQELWRDEAFTAVVVRMPIGDMLSAVSRDSAPPLSYLLDHVVALVDTSPAALRLVSALAGTALIPLVAALARRIRGDSAAVWAAAFVAVVPATVLSSRDARMYALGGTLAVAATLLLWRAIERPALRRWVAYATIAAAAVWTEYFDVFALGAALLAVVIALRPGRRTIATAVAWTALAGASIVPWLVAARAQFEHAGSPFWVEPLGVGPVAGSVVQFLSGPPVDPGVPFQLGLQALQVAAGGAMLIAFWWAWANRRSLDSGGRRAAACCLVAGSAGIFGVLVVSTVRPLLDARYLSVMWLPLFAFGGLGLAFAPRRVALGALFVIAFPTLVLGVAPTRPDASGLLPVIESRLGEHDFIEASPRQYLLLFDEGSAGVRDRLHVVGPVDWFWGTAAYPDGVIVTGVPASVVEQRGRVFAVGEPEDSPPVVPAGYRESAKVCRIRVCLSIFGPPAQ